ncbi:MAG: sigma-E processing peptidase SpoIIGA [Clostridia bacterium]|nr:sigma-E processing peptidase SpoIIGA [Clostridia bacterium]
MIIKGGVGVKQVIYIDVLIFLNTAITFLLLLATSRITKLTPSAGRYVIGSLLGGASSLIIFAPDMGLLLSLLTKLLFSLIIVSVVYKPRRLMITAKQTGYFFSVSFIFVGIMLCIASLPGVSLISYNNGVAYIDLSMFSLIAAAVICYAVTCILNSLTRHSAEGEILYNIKISHNGETVSLSSILDTGNGLTDPFNGESLIIAAQKDVAQLLSEDINNYLRGETDKCSSVRLVPCSTVAGQSLLPVFRADEVKITGGGMAVNIKNAGIAVCTAEIGNVILPSNIFDNCKRRRNNEVVYR